MHELLKDDRDRIVFVNCSIEGKKGTAGYAFFAKGLPAGTHQLFNPINGKKVSIELPEQAVNLPGVGQQFNYPFKVLEES
jgi:hypothetical protein